MKYSWTGYFYGKEVFTTQLTYSDAWIDRSLISVKNGLRRIGWNADQLKDKVILNTGTGLYGIAFAKLGAKQVYTYDLNWTAVERVNKFNKENNLINHKAVTCNLLNIDPEEKFDLIYHSGVFQHLKDPDKGITIFSNALKDNGILYLDFYRSGRWRWFLTNALRRIVKRRFLAPMKELISIHYGIGKKGIENLNIQGYYPIQNLLDDLFVEYSHLFHPDQIEDKAFSLGLVKVFGPTSKDIDDKRDEYNFDLEVDHIFNTFVFDKKYSYYQPTYNRALKPKHQLSDLDFNKDYELEGVNLLCDFIGAVEAGYFTDYQICNILIVLYRSITPFYQDDLYFPGSRYMISKSLEFKDKTRKESLSILRFRMLSDMLKNFLN